MGALFSVPGGFIRGFIYVVIAIAVIACAVSGCPIFSCIWDVLSCCACSTDDDDYGNDIEEESGPRRRERSIPAARSAEWDSNDSERATSPTTERSTLAHASSKNDETHDDEHWARIIQLLEPVRMTLAELHFIKPSVDDPVEYEDPGDSLGSKNLCLAGYTNDNATIRVPVAGMSFDNRLERLAPATCAICLVPYAVDEDIVWSSNSECHHVFHVDCVKQWLVQQPEGNTCPCCRRDFISKIAFDELFEGIHAENSADSRRDIGMGIDDEQE